jgi:uncharacterized membrane protein
MRALLAMAVFAIAPKQTDAIVNSHINFIECFFILRYACHETKRLVKKKFIYLPIKMLPPFSGKPKANSPSQYFSSF